MIEKSYTIQELIDTYSPATGITRSMVRAEIKAGRIKFFWIGNKKRIYQTEFLLWYSKQERRAK